MRYCNQFMLENANEDENTTESLQDAEAMRLFRAILPQALLPN